MSDAPKNPARAGSFRRLLRTLSANERACDEFRELLTNGFYATDADGVVHGPGTPDGDEALARTKGWRGEVWKRFRDLEDRLAPVRKFERTGQP